MYVCTHIHTATYTHYFLKLKNKCTGSKCIPALAFGGREGLGSLRRLVCRVHLVRGRGPSPVGRPQKSGSVVLQSAVSAAEWSRTVCA